MDGFSMDHLYIPSAKVYVTLATMLQVRILIQGLEIAIFSE